MAIFEAGNVSIEVDEDGFMQAPEEWNEEVAAALGSTEGVDALTDDHWKVVNYLRDYYLQRAPAKSPVYPNPRAACNPSFRRRRPRVRRGRFDGLDTPRGSV